MYYLACGKAEYHGKNMLYVSRQQRKKNPTTFFTRNPASLLNNHAALVIILLGQQENEMIWKETFNQIKMVGKRASVCYTIIFSLKSLHYLSSLMSQKGIHKPKIPLKTPKSLPSIPTKTKPEIFFRKSCRNVIFLTFKIHKEFIFIILEENKLKQPLSDHS